LARRPLCRACWLELARGILRQGVSEIITAAGKLPKRHLAERPCSGAPSPWELAVALGPDDGFHLVEPPDVQSLPAEAPDIRTAA
jgi:hypothetical protein